MLNIIRFILVLFVNCSVYIFDIQGAVGMNPILDEKKIIQDDESSSDKKILSFGIRNLSTSHRISAAQAANTIPQVNFMTKQVVPVLSFLPTSEFFIKPNDQQNLYFSSMFLMSGGFVFSCVCRLLEPGSAFLQLSGFFTSLLGVMHLLILLHYRVDLINKQQQQQKSSVEENIIPKENVAILE